MCGFCDTPVTMFQNFLAFEMLSYFVIYDA